MNNRDFDRIVDSVRQLHPDPTVVADASARVWHKLASDTAVAQTGVQANDLCFRFRVDFDGHRAATLSEARRMLLEDHLGSCVACRGLFLAQTSPAQQAIVNSTPNIVSISSFQSRSSPRGGMLRRVSMIAAAAAITVGLGLALPPVLDRALAPSGPRGTVASLQGTLVAVSDEGAATLTVGDEVAEGQEVRTGRDSHAVIRLRDGSLVEMAERSDLNLTERWLGKTIQLTRGNVMVEAAKQRRGRLEVATADLLISVKGTIFGVSRGLQGSRVSVVEGEVQVENSGLTELLHRGDQSVSHPNMARTAVETDIAWSQNAAKYLALLGDLSIVAEKLENIPMPGLRYSSILLDRVPMNAVIVASLPNLGQVLSEATHIFEDRAQDSPVLAEWWNSARSQQMREAVEKIRAVNDYLGEEILVVWTAQGPPVILAQVRREGLREYLTQAGFPGPVALEGDLVAIGSATVPAAGAFRASAFGTRVLDSYRSGAGLLLAADLEQIAPGRVVQTSVSASNSTSLDASTLLGSDNVRFFVAERKANLGRPENTASLTFAGARHGVASWLASPGPIGSLEFISAQASFAAAFVTRDPLVLLQELLAAAGPEADQALRTFQGETGVSPLDDLAGALGSEAVLAIDGAVLPFPEWKLAMEVDNPARLQTSIESLIQQAARYAQGENGMPAPILSSETVEGRKFYALALSRPAITIHYAFVDGYLLAGANRPLLLTAISNRAAALTLPRSPAFRAQLPMDGRGNFSGILYYNFGSVVGPMVDQLKATGLVPAQQQTQIDALTANRDPGIVYMYGEPDRITVGSHSELLSVGLRTLAGLASGNPTSGIPFLGLGLPTGTAADGPASAGREKPTQ